MSGIARTASSASSGLLRRAKENDPQAWQRISDLYVPLVYGWARQAGLQGSDAADISQEVFRVVAGRIGTFRRQQPGDSFTAWLHGITKNKLREFYRRQTIGAVGAGGSAALQKLCEISSSLSEASPHKQLSVRALLLRRTVEAVRAEFEPRTWQAFWRTAVEGHPASEVAAELDLSPAAVRQAKCRVLRRLRQDVDDPS